MTHEPLKRVSDELEIRNLLAKIAQLSDDGELDDYIECFTEDACWGGSGFPERSGHSEILAGARERRASGLAGPGANTRHVLSTCLVTLEEDTAQSRSIFLFYANTQATPVLELIGVWQDELERTPTGWKLARRTIVRSE
jgi:3-phenylpropionate/cinnamic acid dioxygenase small subunit